jgi:hypothetical protein
MFNRDTDAPFFALVAAFIILAVVSSAGWTSSAKNMDCYEQAAVIAEDSITLTDQLAAEVMDRLDDILIGRYSSSAGVDRIGQELRDNKEAIEDLTESCG